MKFSHFFLISVATCCSIEVCYSANTNELAILEENLAQLTLKSQHVEENKLATAPKEAAKNGYQGKKLNNSRLKDLYTVLTIKPIATVRMFVAYGSAIQINKQIDELVTQKISHDDEKVFVKNNLYRMLDPVKEFFDTVREYKELVVPVVKESLIAPEIANESKITEPMEPFLIRYFFIKEDTMSFFERELHDFDTMRAACNEFIVFVSDIRLNMTKDAKTAYDDFAAYIKKLRNKKK